MVSDCGLGVMLAFLQQSYPDSPDMLKVHGAVCMCFVPVFVAICVVALSLMKMPVHFPWDPPCSPQIFCIK